MITQEPSYAQLTREVVHASPEPLSVDEIIKRVNALRPITSKDPESTIRGALGDSVMLVNTGDGRYGWKTRVINGSLLRLTLRESDLLMEVLQWSDELFDALCPTCLAKQMHRDLSPANVLITSRGRAKLVELLLERGADPVEADAVLHGQHVLGHHLARVLAEKEPLVGTVYDDRFFRQSVLVQVREETAYVFINCLDATQVILHVTLVFPANESVATKVRLTKGLVLWSKSRVPLGSLRWRHTLYVAKARFVAPFLCRIKIGTRIEKQIKDGVHVLVDAHLMIACSTRVVLEPVE